MTYGSRSLTPRSTLDTLRKDAKRWRKDIEAGDAAALARYAAVSDPSEKPKLREVQHALGAHPALLRPHLRRRPPGVRADLERAHDAPQVVGVNTRSGVGIQRGQAAVQQPRVAVGAGSGVLALQPLAQAGVGAPALLHQPFQEGADVEPGAAGQEQRAPARADLGRHRARIACVAARAGRAPSTCWRSWACA